MLLWDCPWGWHCLSLALLRGGEAEGKAVGFISLFFLPHSLCDMQGLLESEVQ